MNSTRLPGKSLRPVHGKPMLSYLLERMKTCKRVSAIVVATSELASDDPIANYCAMNGFECFRGPLDDVALRFKKALEFYGFDAFIRVNGDSPLLDPILVDQAVSVFYSGNYDVVTNILHRSFPKGQSVEVMGSALYCGCYQYMCDEFQREHVTRYFYDNADRFRIHNLISEGAFGDMQLSVDTLADMNHFEQLVTAMNRPHLEYGYLDLIDLSRKIRAKQCGEVS